MSDVQENINTASDLKNKGNDFFKNQDYQKALAQYTKIFFICQSY